MNAMARHLTKLNLWLAQSEIAARKLSRQRTRIYQRAAKISARQAIEASAAGFHDDASALLASAQYLNRRALDVATRRA